MMRPREAIGSALLWAWDRRRSAAKKRRDHNQKSLKILWRGRESSTPAKDDAAIVRRHRYRLFEHQAVAARQGRDLVKIAHAPERVASAKIGVEGRVAGRGV